VSDAAEVLDEINGRRGTAWRLVRKLDGGYQGGAYLLEPAAVLKWITPDVNWSAELMALRAELIDRAIGVGWPTPRWLAHGVLADRSPYVVTDLAVGAHRRYDDAVVDALLAAVDLQCDLAAGLEFERDWSSYMRGVTFGGVPWLTQREDLLRFSPAAAELVHVIDRRCAGLEQLDLSATDLVHGDLVADNALFDDEGRLVALIDAQQVGRGSRAIDIAGMVRHTADGDPALNERLHEAGVAVAGPDAFTIFLAASILGVLSFGTWNWPDQVDTAIPTLQALLER